MGAAPRLAYPAGRDLVPGISPAPRMVRVQVWELDRLRVAAHQPQILRSDNDANRVIALLLPQGEALQEHQVHEHALVFVLRGELLVSAGADERSLSAPSLIHFDPAERHEVRAISECQIVLCLAPWPGPGHPSGPATA
jgi:quercetin dioxygenase-like cupin family protein